MEWNGIDIIELIGLDWVGLDWIEWMCQEHLYLADPSSLEYIYTKEEFDELARTVDQASLHGTPP